MIGIPDPKWDERPLLLVVRKTGVDVDAQSIREFLQDKVAKWWIPEHIEFVDDLPLGATGKVSKKDLRACYADYQTTSTTG